MGARKGFKRGYYKKKDIDVILETPWNKNAIEAKLNTVRARIRMFHSSMRGLRNRLRGKLNIKLMEEYQHLNRQLYRVKKAENYLTYQKNML